MRTTHNPGLRPYLRPNRLSYAVSLALASIMAGNGAWAQDSTVQEVAPVAASGDGAIAKVLVVGARASQQSAIDRKKNATTAMDSIIAEDVGAFPDRNVGEAISRISGIALDRGDYGEGVNVSVRGNSPDLTRVEIDGQGVQSGGANLAGRGEGRGVELRELPSDLIKSVDVIKGSTAEMTEGSLGGSIVIKTRTGLDFKKRFFSARVSGAQNSINKKTSPDLNLIFADKYLEDRLGVIVNLNKSRANNESHNISQGGSSDRAGKLRLIDFDNSPEKTFTYDPGLLSSTTNTADQQIEVQNVPFGVNSFASTPRDIVTRSANANTKDDCYAAFPSLTPDQVASIPSGNARNNSINQRSNELLSCLNQWNDYTPNSIRYMVKQQVDERKSGDLRFDFKVNNNLTVYAKGSASRREIVDYYNIFSMGGMNHNPTTVVGPNGQVKPYVDTNGVRSVTPGIGYHLYPGTASFVTGVNPAIPAVRGAVADVIPSSVVVDANHHVTSYTINNATASVDMALGKIDTSADYFQTGGSYRNGGLKAEFMVGDAKSKTRRIDKRVQGLNQVYGQATIQSLPNGLYGYELPANSSFDQLNYDSYVRLSSQVPSVKADPTYKNPPGTTAYSTDQRALVTPTLSAGLFNPRETQTGERTGKLDLAYQPASERLAFISAFKAGVQYRDSRNQTWTTGGFAVQDEVGEYGKANYIPGIYVPTQNLRSTVIGCQDTPGSLAAGGEKCAYGWNPKLDPNDPRSGQMVLTPEQYRALVAGSLNVGPDAQFYRGAKDRPAGMIDGWHTVDVEKFFELSGIPNFNLDCLKECTGSDGKTYQQISESFREKVTAGYLMAEFEFDKLPFSNISLPFGIQIAGNAGWRYVKTDAQASGYLTFVTIEKTASYDAANPSAPGGTVKTTYRRPTSIASNTTDFMPIYNLALWVVPDTFVLRYNHAKTIARPGISRLLPSGTCTYDETRNTEDGDGAIGEQRCTGTMGNPALKPFTNSNRNLSAEWYLNQDTMFTAAVYEQKGIIGAGNLSAPRTGSPFANSDMLDPATGQPLRDMRFTYNQWENLPASTRKGFEVGTKAAFTFLPSFLRFTGVDANYTRNKSAVSAVNYRDLLTGSSLPVIAEPKYSYNASLWYDDGKLSARVALQATAPVFDCIAPCSGTAVNNFPVDGAVNWRVPYNPGSPVFTNGTRFVDAKVSYRFDNGFEVFAEGRNLNRSRRTTSTGGYNNFADGTPNILADAYYGTRIMVGLVYRTM